MNHNNKGIRCDECHLPIELDRPESAFKLRFCSDECEARYKARWFASNEPTGNPKYYDNPEDVHETIMNHQRNETKYSDKPIKTNRSMQGRKCHKCKKVFHKGDIYFRKRVSIGSPGKQAAVTHANAEAGMVVGMGVIVHGIAFTVLLCQGCKRKVSP